MSISIPPKYKDEKIRYKYLDENMLLKKSKAELVGIIKKGSEYRENIEYGDYSFCSSTKEVNDIKLCVYFITDGTFVKVGITHDLKKRLSNLQTSIPYDLVPICAIECKDRFEMEGLEIKLHKQIKSKNIRGEWFSLNSKDIREIVENNDLVATKIA